MTSPSKEIPMGSPAWVSRPCRTQCDHRVVRIKSAVHKAMYCQSLSHPLKQITPFRDECSSHWPHVPATSWIPGRCHVSSHRLLMYPNASDPNKGRAVEPLRCEADRSLPGLSETCRWTLPPQTFLLHLQPWSGSQDASQHAQDGV